MNEDTPRHRPWEEDFASEERRLYAHGFHKVRGLEDLWQKGSGSHKLKESEVYTRQEALKRIEQGMD
jgi:hypothetical protein